MMTAAHARVATSHPSSTATAAHPSSTATVTAAAGAATTMLLAGVRGVSVCGLIGTGDHPLATEIHGRIRRGRQRQRSQQAKRKNNTHAHILLFVMRFHMNSNARTPSAPTSAVEKRGNQT